MAITFDKLKTDAKIFVELSKNAEWWKRFKEDSLLYIEIRKDNQVNVYFEGGSVARIHYCSKHKKLQIFTHKKYLNRESNITYPECSDCIDEKYETILKQVQDCYSQKKGKIGDNMSKEKWSEKYIQAGLIVNNRSIHLDSEFAYNDDQSKNRIDLIKCIDGVVTFVELKRINDGRMLHEDDNTPLEIVDQMERYKQFIEKYEAQLLTYYQRVYDIKMSLGLPVPDNRPVKINLTPELLIFDGWEKSTERRRVHRERMYKILKEKDIKYYTITEI
jgi:hypothetical protein